VHGGELFQSPAVITAREIAQLKQLIPLAPLHNPANILGIETALQLAPNVPQIAVFDTAFHASLPDYAYRYAIPNDWYAKHGVRRYGFHGTSHAYVAQQAAAYLAKPLNTLNLISLHLGNGASACAIQNGNSIDTSMGFSPLAGLIMGTRCGDIDGSIFPYLGERCALSVTEIYAQLNQNSGLLGLAGTNDMRVIHEQMANADEAARRAFAMVCYQIKKYIGAYFAVLGGLDTLIFTGGIGENDARVREQSCAGLEKLALIIDATKNQTAQGKTTAIQAENSTPILVIQTNEALEIAQQAARCLAG
jgi:acetate kinase